MTFSPSAAIVTGSDSGIGRATAIALAEAGMDVGITFHTDEEGAEATAAEVRSHGPAAWVAQFDAAAGPSAVAAIETLVGQLGGLEVFVNNAGTGDSALLVDVTWDQWRHTVASDLDGAFLGIQVAARTMIDQGRGGRIIAITSVHEHQPRVGSSAYDAAMHWLGGLVYSAELVLGVYGISENSDAGG